MCTHSGFTLNNWELIPKWEDISCWKSRLKSVFMYTFKHIYKRHHLWTKFEKNAAIFCSVYSRPLFSWKFCTLWHSHMGVVHASVGYMIWIRHGIEAVVWRLVHHITEFFITAIIYVILLVAREAIDGRTVCTCVDPIGMERGSWRIIGGRSAIFAWNTKKQLFFV